jgi:hypothetical protein
MVVGSSTLSLIAALVFATSALAHNNNNGDGCGNNKFSFGCPDGKDLCLPNGGPNNTPNPPDDLACPNNWYWHSNKEFCVPKNKRNANAIDCPSGFVWTPKKGWCKSQCKRNEFWYAPIEDCLPKGGISNPPSPPRGSACPDKWYWHKVAKVCVPKNANFDPTPDCGNTDLWSPAKGCCIAPPRPTCGRGEFYWADRNICIPHGGPYNPPSPPPGNQCPRNWSWHKGKGCCVPHAPNPPSNPSCPGRWHWKPKPCKCEHDPEPTGRISTPKQRRTNGDVTLCPKGREACPIPGLFGGEYECLNTKVELESCGGCASTGKGQDCTQIPNAWNVGCSEGSCKVYSCLKGYGVNAEGTACHAL